MVNNQRWHIRTRILGMFLALTISAFLLVALLFNLFLHTYIRSSVENQLDALVSGVGERIGWDKKRLHGDGDLPDLSKQKDGHLGTRGNVFIIGEDYTVLDTLPGEIDAAADLASSFPSLGTLSQEIRNQYLATENRSYYVSLVNDMLRSNAFMVFYIDVTAIMDFSYTINAALAVILLAVVLLSFLMANRITHSLTTHVERLSDFAAEIGKGYFETPKPNFRDIEFDCLAQALSQMAQQLTAAHKEQDSFFQNVSHELRTPLMSIRCYAEGIQCGVMNPEQSSATILAETDRLSGLVEDLLYISKMDSQREQSQAEERDLRETMSLCASGQRHIAEKSGITFVFQFDESPVLLSYHEKNMVELCGNLISNALRYAHSSVFLCCHKYGDAVVLSVQDDGDGIAPQELPHIFERFYKGKGGKHGIGLSIVKSVTELYGGKISVSNHPGACFQVTFKNSSI